LLKYASQNCGIYKICDYAARIETKPKIVDSPARKTAAISVRAARTALTATQADLAELLRDLSVPAGDKNSRLIPGAQKIVTAAERSLARALHTLDQAPARLPANRAGQVRRAVTSLIWFRPAQLACILRNPSLGV